MRGPSVPLVSLALFPLLIGGGPAQGQAPEAEPTCKEITEKASPSVPLVLARGPSSEFRVGFGVVIRENGILLTAYHLVKDAGAVQIRFKNGKAFHQVQLLGVDPDRDVAAIRVRADRLPVLPEASASKAKSAESVCIVSDAAARPWTGSRGVITSNDLASRMELADDTLDPGNGYRLLEFIPTSPYAGSSGGVVLDTEARVLGMVLGRLQGKRKIAVADPFSLLFGAGRSLIEIGRSLSYAVPVGDALRLADAPVAQVFESGSALRSLTESRDPDFILRNFRTLYVDGQRAEWFGSQEIKSALDNNSEFHGMSMTIVDDPDFADAILEVGHTYVHTLAWEYPFVLKHQNTRIVLLSGKGSVPRPGPSGAARVAKELINLLVPYRSTVTRKTATVPK